MSARQAAENRKPAVRDIVLSDRRILRVRVWPGAGMPYLLLHGLLDSSEGWSDFAGQTHRPSIAVDLPGFGASSRASAPDLAAYAGDVIEALDALGVEQAVVVGHSLGGAVAAAVADKAPDGVAALGLLAPAGFGRIGLAELVSLPGVRRAVEAGLPLALRSRAALTAAYMTMVTAGRPPRAEVLDRVTSGGRALVPGARDATEAIVTAGRAADGFGKRALRYEGRVHVLWGHHDRLVPIAHLAALQRALPHAHVDVGRFGHHPHRECRERLLRFMNDVYTGTVGPPEVEVAPVALAAAGA